MSMTRLPAPAPSATPSGPNRTASTSGVSETIVMTISLAAATAAGLSSEPDAELLELRGTAGRPIPGADLEARPRGVRGHRARPSSRDPRTPRARRPPHSSTVGRDRSRRHVDSVDRRSSMLLTGADRPAEEVPGGSPVSKIVHAEVVGKDGPKLQKFYGDLFGWKQNTDLPGGYAMTDPAESGIILGTGPGARRQRRLGDVLHHRRERRRDAGQGRGARRQDRDAEVQPRPGHLPRDGRRPRGAHRRDQRGHVTASLSARQLAHWRAPASAPARRGVSMSRSARLTCDHLVTYPPGVDDSTAPAFRALADPSRRLLLDRLFERDGQTLGELTARLPDMTRFGVMRHLGRPGDGRPDHDAEGRAREAPLPQPRPDPAHPRPLDQQVRGAHRRRDERPQRAPGGSTDGRPTRRDRPRLQHLHQRRARSESGGRSPTATTPSQYYYGTRVVSDWHAGLAHPLRLSRTARSRPMAR